MMIRSLPGSFENTDPTDTPPTALVPELPFHNLEPQVKHAGDTGSGETAVFAAATHSARSGRPRADQTMARQLTRLFQQRERRLWETQRAGDGTAPSSSTQAGLDDYFNHPDFQSSALPSSVNNDVSAWLEKSLGAASTLKVDAMPNPWEQPSGSASPDEMPLAFKFLVNSSKTTSKQATASTALPATSGADAAACIQEWQEELSKQPVVDRPKSEDPAPLQKKADSKDNDTDLDTDSEASSAEDMLFETIVQPFTEDAAVSMGNHLMAFLQSMDQPGFRSANAMRLLRDYAGHFEHDENTFRQMSQTQGYHALTCLTEQLCPKMQKDILPYLFAFKLFMDLPEDDEIGIKQRILRLFQACQAAYPDGLKEAIQQKLKEISDLQPASP